jgi:hypothetical protein
MLLMDRCMAILVQMYGFRMYATATMTIKFKVNPVAAVSVNPIISTAFISLLSLFSCSIWLLRECSKFLLLKRFVEFCFFIVLFKFLQ